MNGRAAEGQQAEVDMFDFQATVGITKHIGGQDATDTLVRLCHIAPGDRVLDLGCGVGATTIHLALLGCRVVGVDRAPRMLRRTRERAARYAVDHLVQTTLGDAQALPLDDGSFDAVVVESVLAFATDKPKAARECMRVLKPGGWLGLNEATWLREPSADHEAYLAREMSANARLLDAPGWIDLLFDAGFTDVSSSIHGVDMRAESRNALRRYSASDMAGAWGRTLKLLVTDPSTRRFARSALDMPSDILTAFGYGLYVGRRPE